MDTGADMGTDARVTTIALPELCSGKLKEEKEASTHISKQRQDGEGVGGKWCFRISLCMFIAVHCYSSATNFLQCTGFLRI